MAVNQYVYILHLIPRHRLVYKRTCHVTCCSLCSIHGFRPYVYLYVFQGFFQGFPPEFHWFKGSERLNLLRFTVNPQFESKLMRIKAGHVKKSHLWREILLERSLNAWRSSCAWSSILSYTQKYRIYHIIYYVILSQKKRHFLLDII